ncbi:YigZ family protein [Vibrio ruber]|uniref:IMPACT family member YigZ n=1 Tax=Vibrio ruber (strain DSM 16370 / JCM 11486 / BCRC 17186 / CECT 7878 / LMG 23124 / VR1) TaxID=1123498 RepID=A0A1R4LSS3_VIBR1|nr:YigZ family protein [Vibrio ruber]WNJ97047.1 YigZ family protein [Vibrio ruber]SJN59640.1 IMPACT family member YigZ [Vibrio ruber DSM 16370]
MNDQPYAIPAASVRYDEEIKKSLFMTFLQHTPGIESAKAFIEQIKNHYPDARHHCWAFIAGRPDDSMKWGFSDDGEPSGTAGKPILAQLSGAQVGEITAVVVRYYGGVKLGTGGLVKAYGGGVQQALKQLQTIEKKITKTLNLALDYGLIPLAQSVIQQFGAQELAAQYLQRVVITIEIEIRYIDEFIQVITNKSSARVLVSSNDELNN